VELEKHVKLSFCCSQEHVRLSFCVLRNWYKTFSKTDVSFISNMQNQVLELQYSSMISFIYVS
jgi:hypothetical protein